MYGIWTTETPYIWSQVSRQVWHFCDTSGFFHGHFPRLTAFFQDVATKGCNIFSLGLWLVFLAMCLCFSWFFWGWYHCVHLLHFLFMKKSVKKWAERNTQTFCIFKSGAVVCMKQIVGACVPWFMYYMPLLETQDLWREVMGPQKPQVVTLQPWKSCSLCSLSTATSRWAEGNASWLLYQGSRCQWRPSELLSTTGLGEVDWD